MTRLQLTEPCCSGVALLAKARSSTLSTERSEEGAATSTTFGSMRVILAVPYFVVLLEKFFVVTPPCVGLGQV